MVQEDVFILLTARLTGDGTTSALPAVYERNETPPYIYIYDTLFYNNEVE